MSHAKKILDPDTRIYLCPKDEDEEEPAERSEETNVYVLPDPDSLESIPGQALFDAVCELLERTRRIEARSSWIYQRILEMESHSRKRKYRHS